MLINDEEIQNVINRNYKNIEEYLDASYFNPADMHFYIKGEPNAADAFGKWLMSISQLLLSEKSLKEIDQAKRLEENKND